MQPRPATPDPTGLAVAAVAIELAQLAAGTGEPPEWIKIAHRGELRCRDGRVYHFEPERIVAKFAAERTDVAIDVGHATLRDQAAPAIGYVQQLEARPDGLYGRVDWLDAGRAVLKARSHRYVSPTFDHDDRKHATWLHSVALVSTPALGDMPAIASATPHQDSPTMKELATAFGLSPEANEAACLAALKKDFVTLPIHQGVVAQLSAVSAELAALKKAGHEADVERELEAALKDKKLLPAQKPGFVAMAATPEGFTNVKAILAATAKDSFAGASALDGRAKPDDGTGSVNPVTLAADATKLAKERGIPFVEAMAELTHGGRQAA